MSEEERRKISEKYSVKISNYTKDNSSASEPCADSNKVETFDKPISNLDDGDILSKKNGISFDDLDKVQKTLDRKSVV